MSKCGKIPISRKYVGILKIFFILRVTQSLAVTELTGEENVILVFISVFVDLKIISIDLE